MPTFPPFNKSCVQDELSDESSAALEKLTVLDSIGSTNDVLLNLPLTERHAHAVIADQQTAGRGRRGRDWHSPAGCNLYLSLGWNFTAGIAGLASIPLAVGVAVIRGLEQAGLKGLGVKWPNDIQYEGCKLGGILVESRPSASATGVTSMVLGIGLNIAMPGDSDAARNIGQAWTCVLQLPGFQAEPYREEDLRDRLAGKVLDQVIDCMRSFEQMGFSSFQQDWQRMDVLFGKEINIGRAGEKVVGVAQGVDDDGNLKVAVKLPAGGKQLLRVSSGEVSVRLSGELER